MKIDSQTAGQAVAELKEERMPSIVRDKSFKFAVRIVALCKTLRSGTAIGALIREADQAQSRADFVHKFAVALKEANETAYWLDLLYETGYLSFADFSSLRRDATELLKILTRIVKSTRSTIGRTERNCRRASSDYQLSIVNSQFSGASTR